MKTVQVLWDFFDHFRTSFNPSSYRKLMEFVYVLYFWKKRKCAKENSFSHFYRGEVSAGLLEKSFKQMAKSEPLFELYLETGFYFVKNLKPNDLINICNFVEENEVLPPFLKAISMVLENAKYYDSNFVPKELIELAFGLLNKRTKTIYSPMTTSLNLFEDQPEKIFHVEVEDRSYRTLFQLAEKVDNVNLKFRITNPLRKPTFVKGNAAHLLAKFDASICFPPFGLKIRDKSFVKDDIFNRFKFFDGVGVIETPLIEHLLAQTENRVLVLLPGSFLFKSGRESLFRKFLIESKKVEAIFQLPSNFFPHTSVAASLIVLNNKEFFEKVLFLNLADEYFVSKKRRKNILINVSEAIEIFKARKVKEGISSLVAGPEIKKNEFSFAVERYVLDKETAEITSVVKNFPTIKLSEVVDIRRSQALKNCDSGEKVFEVSPSDLPSSGFAKGIGREKLIDKSSKQFQTYRIMPNDVLLSTKGTIGKVGIVGDEKDFIVSQAFHILRPQGGIKVAKYLYLLFKSKLGQAILNRFASGSVMPQIPANALENMEIPWPSAKEREKFLQAFDEEEKINKDIEELRAKLNSLHENFLIK